MYEELQCPHCGAYFHNAVIEVINSKGILIKTHIEAKCPNCSKSFAYVNERRKNK